jgi:hypothetical protein
LTNSTVASQAASVNTSAIAANNENTFFIKFVFSYKFL